LWLEDRWTHVIDLGPEPWTPAVEAIEWREGDFSAFGPTYQDLFFQRDGEEVVAFAVGQAGPHHFSATFRVSNRIRVAAQVAEGFTSRIEIDVADRCLDQWGTLEARYLVRQPPAYLALSNCLWEAEADCHYHLALDDGFKPPTSVVGKSCHVPKRGWFVGISPSELVARGTTRFIYAWVHERIRSLRNTECEPKE
jgi:hypothetical protein